MKNKTLQEILNESLAKNKDKIAIEWDNQGLSYHELETRTHHIANDLIKRGIKPQTFIGILMEDKMQFIQVILGILRAGCVFVPLDPDLPPHRLEIMIKIADIRLIISDHNRNRWWIDRGIEHLDCRWIRMNEIFSPQEPSWYNDNPGIRCSPEDKIYIYFTSGSTGTPRAMVGKNKSLLHFIRWQINTFGIDETFRCSQLINPMFDAILRDIFVPLCAGGTVCIPDNTDITRDAEKLPDWLEKAGIHLIHCAPALFKVLNSNHLKQDRLKHLKFILLSGERIHPSDIVKWYDTFDERVQLVNLWGTSETTLAKTYYFIRKTDINKERIPIGKPMKGAMVVVLDKAMKICSEQVIGDLYIRTPFRTLGYLNDPELTHERFIQNPFSTDPNDLLHMTGDLGVLLTDGNLDIIGRLDRQVKIRGIRIELEEVESVSGRHPAVNEAAVIKKVTSGNEEFLCAYITTKETDLRVEDLQNYLKEVLPGYMVPSIILKIEKMPRKPNGKIDYHQLPDPLTAREKEYIPPRNPLEKKLRQLWEEILGIEKTGINSHFFELGGNSLNVMSLISKIHKEFDIRIPLGDIFNNPTIKQQAEIIKSAEEDKYTPLEPVEEKEYYALSPGQKRMYFLQRLDLGNMSYNTPQVVMLKRDIHKEKLQAIFKQVIKRHESLRTSFEMIEGQDKPIQKIHKEVNFEIEYFDLNRTQVEVKVEEEQGTRGLAPSFIPAARSTAANPAADIIKDFIRPFDLTNPPLLRVGLIKVDRESPALPTGGDQYILMVDMHHIISDGVSNIVLIQDLAQLLGGDECPGLRIRYRDYSEWQNSLIKGGDIKQQEAYWLKEFVGEIPVLDLPLDFKRPAVQSFAGNYLHFAISKENNQSLEKLALKEEATLHMVLLALLSILFSKLSGQEDIVIGTGTAGRKFPDLQPIMGMFVNTLALRNYPRGQKTFNGFLKEVKEHALEAYDNQDYPFEELVEKADVNKDPARNPLFDVMFVLQNMDLSENRAPHPELIPIGDERKVAKFDLTLAAWESGGQLFFTVSYCTKLFKKETMVRFTNYFKKIVNDVLANPGLKLSDLEIISPEEKHLLLHDFNQIPGEFPKNKTIHELFEDQVEKTPDNIAVGGQVGPGASLTYKELNGCSHQLARLLRLKGVHTDAIVGIMLEPSLEMIIGLIAILKANGAYLPIVPDYPHERIFYMLEDSSAKLLITSDNLFENGTKRRWEDRINLEIIFTNSTSMPGCPASSLPGSHPSTHPPCSPSRSSSLAYVIYTSGSTGKPKGTLTTHFNVIRVVKDCNYIDLRATDRILQLSNYAFDGSVFDIYGALLNGAALVTIERQKVLAAHQLAEVIKNEQITVFFITTALFNVLVDLEVDCFGKVRKILFGGEKVSVEHSAKALKYLGKDRIIHVYGPTETTVYATYYFINHIHETAATIPIGKPISYTAVYILDKYLKPIPTGISGEIYIGGAGVARGYLNNPELTNSKFQFPIPKQTPNPNAQIPNKDVPFGQAMQYHSPHLHPVTPSRQYPIYLTGDLGRWLPEGNIEFLGRLDHQVKIRGFRIETEEIETQILKHEKVKETVVIAKDLQEGGDKYLCAYIITESGFTGEALREYLSGKLPGYMVPRYFLQLENIPLTPNGKVDTRALPLPGPGQSRGTYVPPGNDMESALVNVWQEVLGVQRIGITDNFFEIGGDSIKVIQIIARLKKYRLELNVSDLFLNPTIKELVPCLRPIHREIDQSPVVGEVELTPIQQWFFETRFTHRHHFNHSVMIYKEEGFDENLLEKVFTRITTHHDALRMVYQIEGDNVIQRNRDAKRKSFDLEKFNLRECEDAGAEIQKEANRVQQGINLTTGPLLKLGLFKTGTGDHLLIVLHHLVVDGVSWRILLEDFSIGYQQAQRGEEIRFQDKTDSFKDWSQQLKEYAAGKKALKELGYWQELEQIEIEPLPKDFQIPKEKKKNKNIVKLDFLLNNEETGKLLKKVNWAYNTEINDILLCVLGLAIKDWAGCENLLVNLEGHGREPIIKGVDTSRTVGWFTSQYPVVLDMGNADNLSYEIKLVKETLRRVPNKGIGYGILKYLSPNEKKQGCSLQRNPEISFNYLGEFGQDSGSQHTRLSPLSPGQSISPESRQIFTVSVNGVIMAGRLGVSFYYNRYEYRQSTMKKLANRFKLNLLKVITHCGEKKEKELTPFDLGGSDISLETLDRIKADMAAGMGKDFKTELIYPLSPMQSGMLYHSLSKESKDVDPHFTQGLFSIRGKIEKSLFEKSYNKLIERYDILRTVFVYKELNEPLQVVLKERKAVVYYENIDHLNREEKKTFLEDFMHKDEERGLNPAKDILMRVALFKTGNESYKLLWSFHHILMDGWCLGIIFNDFMRIYGFLQENKPIRLEPVTPYINYIKWIKQQDRQEDLRYWPEYLEGYNQKISLPKLGGVKESGFQWQEHRLIIAEALSESLNRIASANQVTMSTVFQSIWGILLQQYNNCDDVVFGTVVSGRPPEVEEIEHMVGLFINTLPIRIKREEKQDFSSLLKWVQQKSVMAKSYEYLPLAEIQANSLLKRELLDHIIAFENYPVYKGGQKSGQEKEPEIKIDNIVFRGRSGYDLHISIIPGKSFLVKFEFNRNLYGSDYIKKVALHFREITRQVAENHAIQLDEIKISHDFIETRSNILKDDREDWI
jgi:amino acid adenylation domain-containing protein/non-ribosomal peptide synthase protein (TIGR01720 family)